MPAPTDPLLSQQWHLQQNVAGLLDLNVMSVWNPTEGPAYTGAGTTTVVIDDGFDYLHSDLAPNYSTFLDFDFETNVTDAFGNPGSDWHGTAVAGIIGAAADGSGAVGVAFETMLVGYRTYGFISDQWLEDIRDTIFYAGTNAGGDVINISQGIANDTNSEFGVGYDAARFDQIEASIGTAVSQGRGGLGSVIVKAAGNSRGANYDVNADDWTNDTRQVVVAAVDQNGFVSSYSSYGSALLVSGFGTPGEVVTTDRTGADGYSPGDHTTSFNGTSSAAPMVSGVVALMLEANTGLGWRDVQTILGVSARHVGTEVGDVRSGAERYDWAWNAATTWNGGGQHFSNDYGYGLVDAHAAVRMAETWLLTGSSAQNNANEFTNTVDVLNVATVIPDGNAAGLTFSGNASFDDIVERVTVEITFSTTFTADMEIYLISPDGTVSELINDVGGATDFNGTWTFESQAFRGERAAGTWSVRIVDDAGADVLSVSDIVIKTWGSATPGDRYIYTDEYADYAGLSGHNTAVTDTNGGTDTVNAAAVTTSSTIRLDGVVGLIAGQAASFSGIEHAIGGDAGDFIYGSAVGNMLCGMRGADVLYGGDAADTLEGGTNHDTLDGGTGGDTLRGGLGNDRYVVDSYGDVIDESGGDGTDTVETGLGAYSIFTKTDFENLVGTSAAGQMLTGNVGHNAITGAGGNDRLIGSSGDDTLSGNGGNDTLEGGTGANSLAGGLGDDSYVVASFADVLTEAAGEGTDTVVTGLGAYSIFSKANIENLTSSAAGGVKLIGNSLNNVLTGNNIGNDTLIGSTGDDTLVGNGGNDSLDGGTGADSMTGGAGGDTYKVDSYGDAVVEAVGGGTDTIVTSLANYSIFSNGNVENLTGTAGGGGTLTGNTGNNIITGANGNDVFNASGGDDTLFGNGGNDSMDGGSGSDSMTGGAGDDDYSVDSYGDVVIENAAGGTDTIKTSLAVYSIFSNANIENLTATTTIDHSFTGNTGNNVITGANGNDTLVGSGGNDTLNGNGGTDSLEGGTGSDSMAGGTGNDTYVVDSYSDLVTEFAGGGVDTIKTSLASYSIFSRPEIENLTGTSAAGHSLTGNAGNNVLTGAGGSDTLAGGAGNDTLAGGAGADFFVFNTALGAGNVDAIAGFVAADDTFRLENGVFTAIGAAGALVGAAFTIGAAATTAAHRIIYDQATGHLFYDANGNAAGGQQLFATVTAGSAMSALDFFVI